MPDVETKKDETNGAASLAKQDVAGAEIAGALAGRETITWSREQIDLIKKQIAPDGATDAEFQIFILQAQRAQMDPLMSQCFLVPRNVNVGNGRWVEKHVFQAAEIGMAARADRFPDFRGITSAPYYSKDVLVIDAAGGNVKHTYDPTKDRGQLLGAWAVIERAGRRLRVSDVRLSERIQKKRDGTPTQMWGPTGIPETMIEKCARAEAYRVAYPTAFSGCYIEAELPEPEKELNAPPANDDGRSRTDKVREAVQGRLPPPKPQPAATPAAATGPADWVARFGPDGVKEKKLADLTVDQLSALKSSAEKNLIKDPDAKWAPGIRENLKQVEATLEAKRNPVAPRAATPPVEREPGADDVTDGELVDPAKPPF